MEYKKQYNGQFNSATLSKAFSKLDNSICLLEEEIEYYKKENKEQQAQIIELENKIYNQTKHSVGQIFKALLPGTESTDDAATVLLLTKIYELPTIEEVRSFIDNVKNNSLKEIKDKTIKTTSIPKEKWDVHKNHCCSIHGCKYDDSDCPVELELVQQQYPCEVCVSTIM